jgi:hypothetical protein
MVGLGRRDEQTSGEAREAGGGALLSRFSSGIGHREDLRRGPSFVGRIATVSAVAVVPGARKSGGEEEAGTADLFMSFPVVVRFRTIKQMLASSGLTIFERVLMSTETSFRGRLAAV